MPVVMDNPLAAGMDTTYQGHGTVFLAFTDGAYSGYWDLLPDGPPTELERFGGSDDFAIAHEWALCRTPAVLVRPRYDPGQYYWAGLGKATDAHSGLPLLTKERA